MGNKSLPRSSRSNVSALIEPLERRQMLNAAVLRHGRLTVYCDDHCFASVTDANVDPSANVIDVLFRDPMFNPAGTVQFRGTAITRLRIIGQGGSLITLGQTYTPNLTDVAIYTGDVIGNGGNDVSDDTLAHRYNRNERVSIFGGDGNDQLLGGSHTVLIDGGDGNDTLSGGEAGATLNGGDGDDLLSANPIDLASQLEQSQRFSDAAGGVVLNGGAGDDVIVGNDLKAAGFSDTLSGGGGNDSFYPFASDQLVDFGVGDDHNLSSNQFTGSAQVMQTAYLSIVNGPLPPAQPAQDLGYNGPNSRIFSEQIGAQSSPGTLFMRGPTGSTFTLGDLFNAAGYPFAQAEIPDNVTLTVNGFVSPLSSNQIAGYQINNGDDITLVFNF